MEMCKVAIFLLLSLGAAAGTKDYFTGLNIDAALLAETSTAITNLLDTLKANLDCEPR